MMKARVCWLIMILLIGVLIYSPAYPQDYDLMVQVADTAVDPCELNTVITVNMLNWADTIAGFEFWMVLERPDIFHFQTMYDSEIGHYIGNIFLESTLIENWEYVASRSFGELGHDLKITALANLPEEPYTPGIGYPPEEPYLPLLRIMADTYDIPDTLPPEERQCEIFIQTDNMDFFNFSDENGQAIGIIVDTIYDTSWYNCLVWEGDVCIMWEEVAEGPADSFYCCDTLLHNTLDTSMVKIYNGIYTIMQYMCGDANCSGEINILDITYLIEYLYMAGPEPCFRRMSDPNGDTHVNIIDIAYLIDYLYQQGPDPDCAEADVFPCSSWMK